MVKKPTLIVIWNNNAVDYLKKAVDRIKAESPQNAEKVREAIISTVEELIANPEKYPPDKFKKDNPGNYRAFEKYSYRIAYKHSEKEVRILRIRHVKQEPKGY